MNKKTSQRKAVNVSTAVEGADRGNNKKQSQRIDADEEGADTGEDSFEGFVRTMLKALKKGQKDLLDKHEETNNRLSSLENSFKELEERVSGVESKSDELEKGLNYESERVSEIFTQIKTTEDELTRKSN